MGAGHSSNALISVEEQEALERLLGPTALTDEDTALLTVLSSDSLLGHLTLDQLKAFDAHYGNSIASNNDRSRNFSLIAQFLISHLPYCIDTQTGVEDDEIEEDVDVEVYRHMCMNALFLSRHFILRFVDKQTEVPLLTHFQALPQTTKGMQPLLTEPTAKGPPSATNSSSNDLSSPFLDALISFLLSSESVSDENYELYLETVNTLLALLTPVVYPRDYRAPRDSLDQHNPFLNMLMTMPASENTVDLPNRVVLRLLEHVMDDRPSPHLPTFPGSDTGNLSANVTLNNTEKVSLIRISETKETKKEAEQFSYLTLGGIGSIASSIFRFPKKFYDYFVVKDEESAPLAERSLMLVLVLLQSCRDSDTPVLNPYREALYNLKTNVSTNEGAAPTSYHQLLSSLGRKAPYETGHLLLYTLIYSSPSIAAYCTSPTTVGMDDNVLLPLLETLYHAKSVEPGRLYVLVIVLLSFTQDTAFVEAAHTKRWIRQVPWYSERYILDISLGSLMLVIFTRLVLRNIAHFQDSFLHVNAFAALSNLARRAQQLHPYAAQSLISLVSTLAKREASLYKKIGANTSSEEHAGVEIDVNEVEMMAQRERAYVEFIRLLLGIVASCLKADLLPRNPQLIYSMLHEAEVFKMLQSREEFASYILDTPIWRTLVRFQTLVEAKAPKEDGDQAPTVLDVDEVLSTIQNECVSILASTEATRPRNSSQEEPEDDMFRYEEEADPEQFFIPYIWKLIHEQTPDFSWNEEKITLFRVSSRSNGQTQDGDVDRIQ